MRIGIVTIHHVANYGAVLQAYALSQTLGAMGATVEVLDYRPSRAEGHYGGRFRIRGLLRRRAFDRFVSTHLPLSDRRYRSYAELCDGAPRYDALIAGSDQIWCTGAGSFRGYDPAFFLGFCTDPSVAKLSYAASAGDTTSFGDHAPRIASALSMFGALSVRDEATATLIRATTGRQPAVVLDPVFLHDFRPLLDGAEDANEVVVFSSQPERFRDAARRLSRELDASVVSLMHPLVGAGRCRVAASPIAWLRHVRSARVVLTDYFHGLAVALRFGRPVLADLAPGKAHKIGDLLRRAGVEELTLDRPDAVENVLRAAREPEGFAARVRDRLSSQVAASHGFLGQQLDVIRRGLSQPPRAPVPDPRMHLPAAPPPPVRPLAAKS